MSLSLSLNKTGSKPLINIPQKSSGLFGQALNTTTANSTPQSIIKPITQPISQGTTPGLMSAPPVPVQHPTTITAPVKKQTTADGTVTEYHAPTPTLTPDDSSYKYNIQTGKLNPNYKDPNATKVTTPSTPTTTPSNNTYSGLIGRGAEASQGAFNSGSQNYGTANEGLMNIASKGSDAYNKSVDDLTKFRTSVADTRMGIFDSPTSARVMQGRDQAIQAANASKESALTQEVANALAGQGQQISAGSAVLSGGLTSQGQGISGLGTAAGYASPTTQFGVLTDPTTGNPVNGQSAEQAAIAGGRIQGLQSGAQTLGATGGGIQSEQEKISAGYTSALQQGQNLQSQLGDLISTFGLNPSDVNAVNTGLQKIAQNVSSPQYKMLQNYVNDIANTYAQILTPPGGSATDTTRSIATSMLDATAGGQSIITVMKGLDEAAKAKIAGVRTTPTGSTGSTPTSNVTISGKTITF